MNLLLLALVPACFALNPVTGRALAEVLGPTSLALVRWTLSGLVIAAVALMRWRSERWRASPRHLLRVAALGALAMGFCAYAAYVAARTTGATNIGLIYGCASAFVAAWEIAAGRQRPSWRLLLGIAACLAGVVLILSKGHPDVVRDMRFHARRSVGRGRHAGVRRLHGGHAPRAGDPHGHAAIRRHVRRRYVVLLPFALVEVIGGGLPRSTRRRSCGSPWWCLPPGIGAFLGYNVSLVRNGPVLTSASLTLTPAFAAVQAMTLIGERLAWYHGGAIVLVVAGLFLINRDQTRR